MTSVNHASFSLRLNSSEGEFTATIARVGAALVSWKANGVQLVEPGNLEAVGPYCEGIVMAPWPNRLEDGKWNYKGKTLEFPLNIQSQQNANHGLLIDHPYDVVEQTDSSITLGALIHARMAYPFNVYTTVKYELVAGGVVVTHTAENLSDDEAPYAVGGHPYFQIEGVATGDLVLRSNAAAILDVNERQIPIGKLDTAGTRFDLREGVKVGENFYDHDFTGLTRDADGLAHTYLTAPDGRELDIWQGPEFKHVVIFTPDFYWDVSSDEKRIAAAIEPQTAGANAFKTGEDLIWLKKGEKFSTTWGANLLTR
jgi:aldose 1-epimerase